MTNDSQKYHRRSLRLTGYDYSQAGAYFITACAQDRACLFGEVVGGQMHLNEAGRMVLAEWNSLPVRFPGVELDEFGVMPNHIHGIITMATETGRVTGAGGATTRVAPTGDANIGAFEGAAVGIGVVDRTTVGRQPTASPFGQPTELPGPVGATLVVAPPDPDPNSDSIPSTTLACATPRLGDIVGAFKSLTTNLYIHAVKHSGWPPFRERLWQRNYHEHVIRSERSLNRIRQYILDNPANWASDLEHPEAERPEKKPA